MSQINIYGCFCFVLRITKNTIKKNIYIFILPFIVDRIDAATNNKVNDDLLSFSSSNSIKHNWQNKK